MRVSLGTTITSGDFLWVFWGTRGAAALRHGAPRGASCKGGQPDGRARGGQRETADGGGGGPAELPRQVGARDAAGAGAGNSRLAPVGRSADRPRHGTRERDPRWDAVRAGRDERLDDRAAAHGAADHGGHQRRPRRVSDQDDPLASLTVEGYGEGKTTSIEGQG